MNPLDALQKYKQNKLSASDKAKMMAQESKETSSDESNETPQEQDAEKQMGMEMGPANLKDAVAASLMGKKADGSDQGQETPGGAKIIISMDGKELKDPQAIVDALKSMPDIFNLIKSQLFNK